MLCFGTANVLEGLMIKSVLAIGFLGLSTSSGVDVTITFKNAEFPTIILHDLGVTTKTQAKNVHNNLFSLMAHPSYQYLMRIQIVDGPIVFDSANQISVDDETGGEWVAIDCWYNSSVYASGYVPGDSSRMPPGFRLREYQKNIWSSANVKEFDDAVFCADARDAWNAAALYCEELMFGEECLSSSDDLITEWPYESILRRGDAIKLVFTKPQPLSAPPRGLIRSRPFKFQTKQ